MSRRPTRFSRLLSSASTSGQELVQQAVFRVAEWTTVGVRQTQHAARSISRAWLGYTRLSYSSVIL
jgi:hypothetical protein